MNSLSVFKVSIYLYQYFLDGSSSYLFSAQCIFDETFLLWIPKWTLCAINNGYKADLLEYISVDKIPLGL